MRTLFFILGGIILWAAIAGLAKLLNDQVNRGWMPTVIFAAVWLMITGWNVWVGVTQAGYTLMEELPIFLLTYLLPLAIAVVIKRKSTP